MSTNSKWEQPEGDQTSRTIFALKKEPVKEVKVSEQDESPGAAILDICNWEETPEHAGGIR